MHTKDFNSGFQQLSKTNTHSSYARNLCAGCFPEIQNVAKGIWQAEGILLQCPPLNALATTDEAQKKREDH